MDRPDLGKIPLSPGVYIFKGEQGRILYVGKAKQLRKRLSSYFRDEALLPSKTRHMLAKAETLETISTRTENEALLLEASLIKKHRPHYNILLRDDKEYVLFRLDQESDFPRLEIVRQIRNKGARNKGTSNRGAGNKETRGQSGRAGARLFGPYSSARDARTTWKAIHKIFPLRRCSDKSFKNRSRACLYYHIGQCPAPCVLAVDPAEYAETVGKVALLLQGRSRELVRSLRREMSRASEGLDFERAAGLRDQIRAVENTVEKQSVVLEQEKDLDFIGLAEYGGGLGLGLLFVRGGALLGSRNFFWPGLQLEDASELLSSFLLQYYLNLENIPPRVVLPWNPENSVLLQDAAEASPEGEEALREDTALLESPAKEREADDGGELYAADLASLESLLSEQHGLAVRIGLPRNENEERLVSMAAANAREAARQRGEQDLPAMLAQAFGRAEPIERIEAVDVSHTSGSATRAAMVVFDHGRPLRDDWRNYAFSEGSGDDYAVLMAWAERRANAGPPWPDLLLIDGGRGQLGAVYKTFADRGLADAFALAGIAKARDDEGCSDRRAGNISDRIFIPGRSNPLNLKPGSAELLFLQHVRNHVHDFVLGRHRKARSNMALAGELNRIPGFGPSLARSLWEKFNSLHEMAKAGDEDLRAVPGMGEQRIRALRSHLASILDPEAS